MERYSFIHLEDQENVQTSIKLNGKALKHVKSDDYLRPRMGDPTGVFHWNLVNS